jgi:hypothetical protein
MWALNPFDTRSSKPLGVRLKSGFGLTAGQAVALFEVDPRSGRATWAADAPLSGDGKSAQTAAGRGLSRITWLIVGVAN